MDDVCSVRISGPDHHFQRTLDDEAFQVLLHAIVETSEHGRVVGQRDTAHAIELRVVDDAGDVGCYYVDAAGAEFVLRLIQAGDTVQQIREGELTFEGLASIHHATRVSERIAVALVFQRALRGLGQPIPVEDVYAILQSGDAKSFENGLTEAISRGWIEKTTPTTLRLTTLGADKMDNGFGG